MYVRIRFSLAWCFIALSLHSMKCDNALQCLTSEYQIVKTGLLELLNKCVNHVKATFSLWAVSTQMHRLLPTSTSFLKRLQFTHDIFYGQYWYIEILINVSNPEDFYIQTRQIGQTCMQFTKKG